MNIPLMHRPILIGEKWRWYFHNAAAPLSAAIAVVLLCRALIPSQPYRTGEIAAALLNLGSVSGCVRLLGLTPTEPVPSLSFLQAKGCSSLRARG